MIDAIQTLAHANIDWSVGGGMIWLVSGLCVVAIPLTIVAVMDLVQT
jgi:hypothetical protein